MTRIWTANVATIAHRCRKFNSWRLPSRPSQGHGGYPGGQYAQHQHQRLRVGSVFLYRAVDGAV